PSGPVGVCGSLPLWAAPIGLSPDRAFHPRAPRRADGDRPPLRVRPPLVQSSAGGRARGALRSGGERARHLGCRSLDRRPGAGADGHPASLDLRETLVPSTAPGLLAVGFVLGLRHALDVDHLAAVSTIVSQRRSLWSSS